MSTLLRPVAVFFGLLSLITGVFYPFFITGAAQLLFPSQASGSLMYQDGHAVGSSLIGQAFDDPRYFWGRPSATSPYPYNATASTGSNWGPSNPALAEAVRRRVAALRVAGGGGRRTVAAFPVDLVTTSASGLDPEVSPAAALVQVDRVARIRGLTEGRVRDLVNRQVVGRSLDLFGEPRVNVLRLNVALDDLTRMSGRMDERSERP